MKTGLTPRALLLSSVILDPPYFRLPRQSLKSVSLTSRRFQIMEAVSVVLLRLLDCLAIV
ncbi:MAG: hypothetical protein P4L46_25485 [Fimbriimonas sp.]|nr:hypothetical protein [Fimbriimonas sp.]